jgi:hypothetical protein
MKTLPWALGAAALVDLDRYPIDWPGSWAYEALVEAGRARLEADGILPLNRFLSAQGLMALKEEAELIESQGYSRENTHTPYFTDPDFSKPPSHPLRRTASTRKRSIARHLLDAESAMNAHYEWPPIRRLIGDLFGIETLYPHDDPSNALVLSASGAGDAHGWHFDKAYFTVTLLLREPEGGGEFEYLTDIRSDADENYPCVQEALEGKSSGVRTANMREGTLVIFKGRDSLHRVRPVTGAVTRHLLIFHLEEKPGVRISREYRQLIFGPNAPAD